MLQRTLFLLLFVLASHRLHASCSRVLPVPFEHWPPYSFLDQSGKPAGLEVEILTAVAKEAGCKVHWLMDLPRIRRWVYFKNGKMDMLLAGTDTKPEAHRHAWYSATYRPEIIAAFTRDDGRHPPKIVTLQQMLDNKVPLVVQTGSTDIPLYFDFQAAGLLTRYEDYDKGILLLQHQRGDVLIGDQSAVLHAAKQVGVRLRILETHVMTGEVAYMLSKGTLDRLDLQTINRAIGRLRKNGTLAQIWRRWGAVGYHPDQLSPSDVGKSP